MPFKLVFYASYHRKEKVYPINGGFVKEDLDGTKWTFTHLLWEGSFPYTLEKPFMDIDRKGLTIKRYGMKMQTLKESHILIQQR